eukprot:CAMPEP_0113304652 /NCGR_PEP_ID=MMETSP0010_2-20120614/4582_1 /TAXON_ID=216773 ORGANISM="Corethron hystrix, Strain 308" /NCGR_SAMPLE_ID=MMETSP0010_2 /ASSEMBLY_ACC=CAM_ASM_000155 /LENGTH=80 /DNA_ID=CAMNT_0000158891 /DNA_START=942 /DNA_END=1184 /DNA_ORIENTATION=+ /assembly_acc=CAM_ASM_000155
MNYLRKMYWGDSVSLALDLGKDYLKDDHLEYLKVFLMVTMKEMYWGDLMGLALDLGKVYLKDDHLEYLKAFLMVIMKVMV